MSSSDNVKLLPRPWHGKEGPATLDDALSYVRVSDALWDTTEAAGVGQQPAAQPTPLEKLDMRIAADDVLYLAAAQSNKNIVWWLHHALEAAADGNISRLVYAARQVVQKLNNEAYATKHRKRKPVTIIPPTRKVKR